MVERNLLFHKVSNHWFSGRNYLGSAVSPLCLLLNPAEGLSLLHEDLSPLEELSSQKVLPDLHAVPK